MILRKIMNNFERKLFLIKILKWEKWLQEISSRTSFARFFFMFILLISNHTVFLAQFGINLHREFFKKLRFYSRKQRVHFRIFEKLTRAN